MADLHVEQKKLAYYETEGNFAWSVNEIKTVEAWWK